MKIFEPIPDTKRATTRKTSGARSKTRSPSMKDQKSSTKKTVPETGKRTQSSAKTTRVCGPHHG